VHVVVCSLATFSSSHSCLFSFGFVCRRLEDNGRRVGVLRVHSDYFLRACVGPILSHCSPVLPKGKQCLRPPIRPWRFNWRQITCIQSFTSNTSCNIVSVRKTMIISFTLDNVYSKFPLRPPFVTDTDRLQCIWSYLRESIARKNLFGTEDRWSFYRVVLLSSGLIIEWSY